jgi:hypothetical protein
VDASLHGLDDVLTAVSQRQIGPNNGFFRIEQDFYRFASKDNSRVRSYAFGVGPLKWRFFWARIGQGLYVASKPFIIEDLLALEAQSGPTTPADAGPEGHGLVRVRPLHWSRVLPQYRIGWAENQRRACLHNLGPLSSLSRGLSAQSGTALSNSGEAGLHQLARQLYDADFFCPDGGQYVVSPDGNSVTCTVHGSAAAPRQPLQPSDQSRLGALLRDFADLTLALTFLEDGLHAVVTLERK